MGGRLSRKWFGNKSYNTGGSWPTWEDRHGIVRYGFWEVRIWILGMWMVPYPVLIRAATSKNIYKTCSKISKKNQYIYIRVRGFPERDILSLRTLGWDWTGFGRPSAGAVQRSEILGYKLPGWTRHGVLVWNKVSVK